MSFDLAIWRRSPTTKTAMIVQVYDVLGVNDQDHPAATHFDAQEFVDAACSTYGRLPESDAELAWIGIYDEAGEGAAVSLHAWTGETTALVRVSGPSPWLDATVQALMPLVVQRNLMLYDPQRQAVYNNQRSYA